MNKRTKNKIILSLTLLYILINTIVILNLNNIEVATFENSSSNDITNTPVNNKQYNFTREENLGNLLGITFEYKSPISPLYVKPINLASYNSDEEPTISLINTTKFDINIEAVIQNAIQTNINNTGLPIVLIIHTHGTESFVPNNKNYYLEDTEFNSTDISKNIVAVGEEFCKVLEDNNIPYIHDKTMFDENSYKLAYKNSGIAVGEYLEKYPSIKYVIDIHRDTISDNKNIHQKPVTIINGKSAAQIMFVVGTNASGAEHQNWRDNLSVVIKFQEIINEKYPTLARPIYIHTSSFNQAYLPTMMLLEIGASGNNLTEAKNSARLTAECFVEMLNRY